MLNEIFDKIYEYNHKDILRKQKSITRLFPTFHRRVDKVIDKGGIRMVDMDKDSWTFKLHSGTDDNKWYKGTIQFKDVETYLEKAISNKKVWNKDRTNIDLTKLAGLMIDRVDLRLECSCLVGDTKIPLLDGTTKTIQELYDIYGDNNSFWVYSSDDNGDFVPGLAKCVGQTGQVKELIEVVLDNNKKIRCTPDHLFRLRDGSYKQASELKINDSLMPLYTRKTKSVTEYSQSYKQVQRNSKVDKDGNFIWENAHSVVANTLLAGSKNHKVKCVNKITKRKPVPVYDIYVEKYHNFAVSSGVFVHNCPAFLYWGSSYILTQKDAKTPPPENRPPKKRNPKQYGAVCKHLHTLFKAYPFYRGTMSSWLKKYYTPFISEQVKKMKQPEKQQDVKESKYDISHIRIRIPGSCMFVAKEITEQLLEKGISDFVVVEGHITFSNVHTDGDLLFEHTWIEYHDKIIDPSKVQFVKMGYDLSHLVYTNKKRTVYTPYDYLAIYDRNPITQEEKDKYFEH